jgi:hypothetical protein
MTNFQGEPLTRSTLPVPLSPPPGLATARHARAPYTFGMSTEDDLRHLGQAAAALAGMAAARAKQVAEQLLGPRPQPREDAKQRAGRFVEEGRHAAADVVSALRREASVILRDLEHLEQSLRAQEGDGNGAAAKAGDRTATVTPIERAPAKRGASRASGTAKTAAPGSRGPGSRGPGSQGPGSQGKATKTTTPAKAAAAKAAKKTAPQAKKAAGGKAAGARKTTGGPGRSSSEGRD